MCDGLVIDLTGVSFQEHAPVNYREELNITTGVIRAKVVDTNDQRPTRRAEGRRSRPDRAHDRRPGQRHQRRIKGAGAITETAEYQIYRAQALGASKKEVERRVAEQLKLQEEVISSLFEYVLDKSLAYEDNGSLQQMADAYAEMTKSKTAEMLQNLWGTAPDGQVLSLQDAYARALDFAFRETATGVLDMETAIRRAVMPLAKRGLRTIEQKSGRSIGIEYACRRYIMDQLGALDDEVQKANHDRLGCDGWEISAHAACAPDHEPIQGRQYSDAEYEQLNNSLQRRIGHLNCGHTASPIILGVNAPQYTEAELKQFAEDNERVSPTTASITRCTRPAGAGHHGKRHPQPAPADFGR